MFNGFYGPRQTFQLRNAGHQRLGYAHVAQRICRKAGHAASGCVLGERSVPGVAQEENREVVADFDVLPALAEEQGRDLRPNGCDRGDLPPDLWCRVASQRIHADMIPFNTLFSSGEGRRVVVSIDPERVQHDKLETPDVL